MNAEGLRGFVFNFLVFLFCFFLYFVVSITASLGGASICSMLLKTAYFCSFLCHSKKGGEEKKKREGEKKS